VVALLGLLSAMTCQARDFTFCWKCGDAVRCLQLQERDGCSSRDALHQASNKTQRNSRIIGIGEEQYVVNKHIRTKNHTSALPANRPVIESNAQIFNLAMAFR